MHAADGYSARGARASRAPVWCITESAVTSATACEVWDVLCDVDRWWLNAGGDHPGDGDDVDVSALVGTRVTMREQVGGIPADTAGTIIGAQQGSLVAWQADPRCRWAGFPARVREELTWQLRPQEERGTLISAHLSTTFGSSVIGRLNAFALVNLARATTRDRASLRAEVRYLKRIVEDTQGWL